MSHSKNMTDILKNIYIIIPDLKNEAGEKEFLSELISSNIPSVVISNKNILHKNQLMLSSTISWLPKLKKNDSYISALNVGVQFALKKNPTFICVLNPAVKNGTLHLAELIHVLLQQKNVGACAPARAFSSINKIAYRIKWSLQLFNATYDFTYPFPNAEVVEADFCELHLAVFPAEVFKKVGLFDEKFSDLGAIVDFGYRLWLNHYRVTYCPSIVISGHHLLSFSNEVLKKDRDYFSKKHFNYGINYSFSNKEISLSWQNVEENFNLYLNKYGLIDQTRPDLVLSHPVSPCSYLFTVWETTKLPNAWTKGIKSYKHIFMPSKWNVSVFKQAGAKRVSFVPFGICPDIYHPYGPAFKFKAEKAFLVVSQHQHRKALDVTITVWLETKDKMPTAWLYLFSHGLDHVTLLGQPDRTMLEGKIKRYDYLQKNISYLQPIEKISPENLAELYRGAHVFINNSRSEGFGFPILEAMACETLTIVPNYSATAEFIHDNNCIPLDGKETIADYTDMGFDEVGNWWMPSPSHLKNCLLKAYFISNKENKKMTQSARQFVLTNYTWRNSMLTMRAELKKIQRAKSRNFLLLEKNRNTRLQKKIITLGKKISQFGMVAEEKGYRVAMKQASGFLIKWIRKNNYFLLKKYIFEKKKKLSLSSNDEFIRHLKIQDKNKYPKRKKWYNSSHPQLSILILNYNKPDITIQCIKEIWRHTTGCSYEIVLIDNGSTIENYLALNSIDTNYCHLIRLQQNRYFPEGNNIAAQFAKGKYLFCLNNDAFVTAHWLEPLMTVIKSNPEVGIVGPMFLYPNGLLQEAGATVDKNGMTLLIGDGKDPHASQYNQKKEVDYISGAGLLIKKSLFENVLGFDTFYEYGYYEDVDLALKIKLLNKKVIYCPKSRIIHIKGYTSSEYRFDTHQSIRKNHAKFMRRWQPFLNNEKDFNDDLMLKYTPTNHFTKKVFSTIGIYFPNKMVINGKIKSLLTIASHFSRDHRVTLLFSEVYSQLALQNCLHQFLINSDNILVEKIDNVKNKVKFDFFISTEHLMADDIYLLGVKNYYYFQFPLSGVPNKNQINYLVAYDGIFVCSAYTKNWLAELFNEHKISIKPIHVVYGPGVNEKEVHGTYRKPKNNINLLMVGNFVENSYKNHQYLIDFFLKNYKKFLLPISLHLAGNLYDIDYLSKLKSVASNVPIYFHFDLSFSALKKLYQSSHIYWHASGMINSFCTSPTNINPFELTLIEAMSYGCVPIIYPYGGAVEIVTDQLNGLYYTDQNQLFHQTNKLINHSNVLSTLSKNAIEKATNFSKEEFVKRIVKLLQ